MRLTRIQSLQLLFFLETHEDPVISACATETVDCQARVFFSKETFRETNETLSRLDI